MLIAALTLYASNAWGAANEREPHIGYLYPAGGQQGSVFKVIVGGQFLKDANNVYVSGKGIHGSVEQYVGKVKPLNGDQRRELQRRLNVLRQKQQGAGPKKQNANRPDVNEPGDMNMKEVTLPDIPILRNLDKLSPKGLQKVTEEFLSNRFPASAQISEIAVIEITIDPNTEPGDRELRLGTVRGLTNPLCFQVGELAEISEPEFKDPGKLFTQRAQLPVLLNGQIMPGESDRFRFSAKSGQNLTIEAQGRHLIPYLADAVPGWFQVTLALYDGKGKEVAYADNYRFNPDPVLFYRIADDGDYEIEVRDAIYRGREDFVYRISISERPFITQIFPLGAKVGSTTVASVRGWNLDVNELTLDTGPEGGPIRQTQLRQSNSISYAADTLPECNEIEDNNNTETAQQIELSTIINGRIIKPGDADVFRLDCNGGDEVVAEVSARRLNSPLDSLLWLTDANGQVLARNDDNTDVNIGLLTHNADSYLWIKIPKAGAYFVHLADSQSHGGPDYGYRLRISAPQPDFVVFAAPSSINVFPGGTIPVNVVVLRKDGFAGEIELALKDAPAGFKLGGARIPAGQDHLRITLTAPQKPFNEPVELRLEAKAKIEVQTISRPVYPSEDMMQAFIYQHWVKSQQLLVAIRDVKRRVPAFELISGDRVKIPVGGKRRVEFRIPNRPIAPGFQLELSDPPAGLTLADVNFAPGLMTFALKADSNTAKAGLADNLIVEVSIDPPNNPKGNPKAPRQKVYIGVLPAITCEIVRPQEVESRTGKND